MRVEMLTNQEFSTLAKETKNYMKELPKRKRRKFAKKFLKETETTSIYVREIPNQNIYDYIADVFEIMGYWCGDRNRALYNITTDEFYLQERRLG